MIKTYVRSWCLILLSCSWGNAQEYDNQSPGDHDFKHHRIALIIGHGHVFGAENIDSGKNIVTIPTWGFDYQYWINPKFGLGLKSDIEIMDYLIETHDEISLSPFMIKYGV